MMPMTIRVGDIDLNVEPGDKDVLSVIIRALAAARIPAQMNMTAKPIVEAPESEEEEDSLSAKAVIAPKARQLKSSFVTPSPKGSSVAIDVISQLKMSGFTN